MPLKLNGFYVKQRGAATLFPRGTLQPRFFRAATDEAIFRPAADSAHAARRVADESRERGKMRKFAELERSLITSRRKQSGQGASITTRGTVAGGAVHPTSKRDTPWIIMDLLQSTARCDRVARSLSPSRRGSGRFSGLYSSFRNCLSRKGAERSRCVEHVNDAFAAASEELLGSPWPVNSDECSRRLLYL